ncbi:MAG: glycosyltransferase [Akkermansiaceae bacterium]|nr:glycosyltransferase [Akkermansiaceae bacterium]
MFILTPILLVLWTLGWWLRPRLNAPLPRESCQAQPGKVSLIVPARNEAHNLPRLIHSIRAQKDWPLELLVIDDESEDRTAEIARAMGATVISSKPLPEGWRGKTWACHQGAQEAKGDYLCFLDADTWWEKHGFKHLLSQYESGALAVGPWHQIEESYESASLFFNLAMVAGTVPNGLFGQCLLISREDYKACGGHEAVRAAVLENLKLREHLERKGIPARSIPGRGMINFRMYPDGMGQVIEGWTKGFASGAGNTPPAVMAVIVLWMIGLMIAAISLAVFPGLAMLILYLAFAMQVAILGRKVGAFPPMLGLIYPLPLLFFFGLYARSALKSGQKVTWKGRRFDAA